MKRMLLLASLVLPVNTASSQSLPSPRPAVPWQLLAWMPGEVRCGGTSVIPLALRRPITSIRRGNRYDATDALTYRFRIDASGRALSIRREGGGAPWSDDVAPSLAASRFGAGAPQADCTIRFTLRAMSPEEAPVGDLISYSLEPQSGELPPDGWARIQSPQASCLTEPRPRPLVAVYPDFDKLPGTPGVKHWTMVAYDQDARGRPIHVRTVEGTGSAALDRAAVRAMRKSRFTGGARAACLFPFWRAPTTLAAPTPPSEDSLRPADSNCPHSGDWATPPTLTYPNGYPRRAIEGWAVVAFDVAPWGELGNLRVLASEPTADFGEQAIHVLRSARKPASATGRSGCVDRVIFKMGYGGLPLGKDPG